MELYQRLADVTVVTHFLLVLFVVVGQVLILFGWWLGWHWPRHPWFRIAHLIMIGFVVLEAWFGVTCPLTVLENHLRELAGTGGYEMSFVGYWVHRWLFYTAAPWVFTLIYTLFGLLVLVSFIFYPPLRRVE